MKRQSKKWRNLTLFSSRASPIKLRGENLISTSAPNFKQIIPSLSRGTSPCNQSCEGPLGPPKAHAVCTKLRLPTPPQLGGLCMQHNTLVLTSITTGLHMTWLEDSTPGSENLNQKWSQDTHRPQLAFSFILLLSLVSHPNILSFNPQLFRHSRISNTIMAIAYRVVSISG